MNHGVRSTTINAVLTGSNASKREGASAMDLAPGIAVNKPFSGHGTAAGCGDHNGLHKGVT